MIKVHIDISSLTDLLFHNLYLNKHNKQELSKGQHAQLFAIVLKYKIINKILKELDIITISSKDCIKFRIDQTTGNEDIAWIHEVA